MASGERAVGLVPALLKQWRAQHGLSQLDLALLADVSSRHISFLETGRSVPSPEMVLRLGAAVGAPLRQVNMMLVAAGHDPAFEEPAHGLPASVADAVALLGEHHEPFPLIVVDRTYEVRSMNAGAVAVLAAILGAGPAPGDEPSGLNLARLTFDPGIARTHLVNFPDVGRELLWRIQREVLESPDDLELRSLLEELLASPVVDDDWRQVDLSLPSEPALMLHLRGAGLDLRFLTTVTVFQAPQNVAVEQVRIEHWLPYDEATVAACRELAGG